ncbi:MAG: hypothetical protein ACREAE_03290, partial [Nitrosopumilaceae archaeon]
ENFYSGILTYSASENIQLVSLRGPIAEGEEMGQPIWTPDGITKFALTLVDPENAMGSWEFTGNALAVHTMNTEPFTVSYYVTANPATAARPMEETPMEEGIKSPLLQVKDGTSPSDVVCKEGLELILKVRDGSAACVTPSTASALIQRGWGITAS